jgi:hypothetical protein
MKDGKYEESDLSKEALDAIDEEVRRISSSTIRSDAAIRQDLINQRLAKLNDGK